MVDGHAQAQRLARAALGRIGEHLHGDDGLAAAHAKAEGKGDHRQRHRTREKRQQHESRGAAEKGARQYALFVEPRDQARQGQAHHKSGCRIHRQHHADRRGRQADAVGVDRQIKLEQILARLQQAAGGQRAAHTARAQHAADAGVAARFAPATVRHAPAKDRQRHQRQQ